MSSLAPRVLVIDVPPTKVRPVVEFWAAALDATPRWPEHDDDPFVPLDGARSVLQVVVQSAPGVARYHVDLPAADVDVATRRLLGLGATRVRHDHGHDVLRDPAGLLLCVAPPDLDVGTVAERVPQRCYLDTLFVDVPGRRLVDTQVAFWADVLGASINETSRPETTTALAGAHGPGGPLLVVVQRLRDGSSRFHVDLSADDVAAEAARLEALGATRVDEHETWVTLADPAGNLLCVVPA